MPCNPIFFVSLQPKNTVAMSSQHHPRYPRRLRSAGLRMGLLLLLLGGQATASAQCDAQSTQGTDFWFAYLNNISYSRYSFLSFMVTGTPGTTIHIENPNIPWDTTLLLAANNLSFDLPNEVAHIPAPDQIMNAGIHVTASKPISLYASNYTANSYDITLVLPSNALDSIYYPQSVKSPTSELGIVATEDSTVITITNLDSNEYTYIPFNSSVPITISRPATYTSDTLMRGQALLVNHFSFSGSRVASNGKPFALFQGDLCAFVGDCMACDHLFEQTFPPKIWGENYLLVPTAMRSLGSDAFLVTAVSDSCVLYLDSVVVDTLNYGESRTIRPPTLAPAMLSASSPVTVGLYFKGFACDSIIGDPSSVMIPPVEQRIREFTFRAINTVATSDHFVCVVCRTVDLPFMLFDGNPIGLRFDSYDNGYSCAVFPITEGTHRLTNYQGGMIAYFYGLGSAESYSYIAGMATYNLNNRLYVDNHDTRTYTGLFTYCQDDTAHLRTATRAGNDPVNADWYVDSVLVATSTSTLNLAFPEPGQHTVSAVILPCDTISTLLFIKPHLYDTLQVHLCDQPSFRFADSTLTASGTYLFPHTSILGCPADTVLQLALAASTLNATIDTTCFNAPYRWNNLILNTPGTYLDTLLNAAGCDSVLRLDLAVIPEPHFAIDTVTVCNARHYILSPALDSIGWPPYRWLATPADTLLRGHEHDSSIIVSPVWTTLYTLDVDWRCHLRKSILLAPMPLITADIKTIPEIMGFDVPWIDAYDASRNAQWAEWWINDEYAGVSGSVHYDANPPADTVRLRLVAHHGSCTDTTTRTVTFMPVALWAPNTFTPEIDDNRIFRIHLYNAQAEALYIYNRSGLLVYSADNVEQGWDGTHHGTPCPQGAYVWHLVYRAADFPGETQKRTGTITLLR